MGVAAAQTAAPTVAPPAPVPLSVPSRPHLRLVQRTCECGSSAGPSGRCESCNETILRPKREGAAAAVGGHLAPPLVHQALATTGEALDPIARDQLEGMLGHDLSRVRIHTGPLADASARAVGARAYTVGQDIVFRDGLFQPHTREGRRLLAHELTHTVQQAHARPAAELRVGPSHDAHEHAAARAAELPAAMPPAPKTAAAPKPELKAAPKPAPTPAAAKPAPPIVAPAAAAAHAPAKPASPSPMIARAAAPAKAAAPAPTQRVQRAGDDAAAPEQSGGVLDSLANLGADAFWAIVTRVAPAGVVAILQQIRQSGILGFLKNKLSGVFNALFGALSPASGGKIAGLLAAFTQLMGSARTILVALAHNDCKPLFDAVGKLGDTLGTMAGDAWDSIKAFLAPVGDFFSGLWTKFGMPVVNFLEDVAADTWNSIKALGAQIWSVVSDIGSAAWGWLKGVLGISSGGDDQGGLIQWVEDKLGQVWDGIKAQLDPVIAPIKAFAAKVAAALPLDAILNLRQTIHEWLQHAGSMVGSLQAPNGATANQASLRAKILPAIKAAIVKLGGSISDAGGWVASQIGGVVASATQMLSSIKSNPVLGLASGAIDWLGEKARALGDWVQSGVKAVFDIAGQGVAKLSGFVDPVLGVLEKLAKLIGNIVKMLPDLVLGPVWALIPACIKDPIKDFIIKNILTEIPVIGTFVKIPNIWTKIQNLVLDFLAKVFVDGDLGGAALMVIRFVLEAVGVDVNLFLKVLGKAIGTLDDIMMHPMNFLKNIGTAIVMGFQRFWDHIGANLLAGLQGWIFGALEGTGITPLKDLSLGSLFQLAMQVLGITMAKLRAKLEKAIGAKAMGVVDKVANVLTEAWHWITLLWNKGPAGVWEEIKERAADLGKAVISGITNWIAGDLIKIGIAKIAKLSNPAGEIIELIQTIMKTIDFVVTKMNRILAVADSVLNSIGAIVAGTLGPAAEGVEKALVNALSAVLTFLADWLGVSNPGDKIRGIVETVQAKVDVALDWLIAKAISIVQKLFGKGKDDKKDANKDPKWTAAVAAVNAQLKTMEAATSDGKLTQEQIAAKLPEWKTTYGFTSLTVTPKGSVNEIMGAMSPPDVVADVPAEADGKDKDHPIEFAWVKPAAAAYPPITLAPPDQVAGISAKWGGVPLAELNKLPGKFTVSPTSSRTLTKMTIGLAAPYRIADGYVFQAKSPTPRGGTVGQFNAELKDWGYNRDDNAAPSTDGDHVMELQVGGADDPVNLWPLNASVNRSSGGAVKRERERILGALSIKDLNGRFVKIKLTGGA
jgi:hypothetical protein